jgi:tetratricopeptide (TPR) repeat protein
MKKDALPFSIIVLGLAAVVLLAHWLDDHRQDMNARFSEERLYVDGATAKRLTFAFNGLAADWYWMRSLQYVGRKIVNYEDTHDGRFSLNDLSALDLHLLPSLLRVTATLDPQFMAPYEYGAVILPELNQNEAIALLNSGIAANPSSWRLYQHLGYIYWQRKDFAQASDVYAAGAKLPGAPAWMAAISARMKAEGGSRDAAREMYRHLYEASNDKAVEEMVTKQITRLDSLDERDAIRRILTDYRAQSGRCVSSWRDVAGALRTARLTIDSPSGAPLDPSNAPYRLIKDGCDVDLNENTRVPKR